MRRMCFAHTTEQIRARTKTVTRRRGWYFLRAGDRLLAVDRIRSRDVEKLAILEVTDVRIEPLRDILSEDGATEREGYPELSPEEFIDLFRAATLCQPDSLVTRIEFRYVD